LGPINLSGRNIERYADTPVARIAAVRISLPGLDECLDVRPIEIRAHHAHAFAVRPVELSMNRIELELLWRERPTSGNDRGQMTTVEIGSLDEPVISGSLSHDRPVDVTAVGVDGDPVRNTGASRNEHLKVRTIWCS
jgi:hypothetical protein